jgi:hypothetical protein
LLLRLLLLLLLLLRSVAAAVLEGRHDLHQRAQPHRTSWPHLAAAAAAALLL